MKEDTAIIANEALEFYNNKEGTNYKLEKPLLSWCNLFPDGLIIHANFKAVDNEAADGGEIKLFFSETHTAYNKEPVVLHCFTMDKSSSDIRRGCAHCPSRIGKRSFYHPPVGQTQFGDDEDEDNAKFPLSDTSDENQSPPLDSGHGDRISDSLSQAATCSDIRRGFLYCPSHIRRKSLSHGKVRVG